MMRVANRQGRVLFEVVSYFYFPAAPCINVYRYKGPRLHGYASDVEREVAAALRAHRSAKVVGELSDAPFVALGEG